MKTLQSNFTTPEQSKRLLELGVPAWTADCCFSKRKDSDFICEGVMHIIPDNFCVQSIPFPAYPCWSVGRLIEIYCFAAGIEYIKICISEISQIEAMLKMIEIAVTVKTFDFSKLED